MAAQQIDGAQKDSAKKSEPDASSCQEAAAPKMAKVGRASEMEEHLSVAKSKSNRGSSSLVNDKETLFQHSNIGS